MYNKYTIHIDSIYMVYTNSLYMIRLGKKIHSFCNLCSTNILTEGSSRQYTVGYLLNRMCPILVNRCMELQITNVIQKITKTTIVIFVIFWITFVKIDLLFAKKG